MGMFGFSGDVPGYMIMQSDLEKDRVIKLYEQCIDRGYPREEAIEAALTADDISYDDILDMDWEIIEYKLDITIERS